MSGFSSNFSNVSMTANDLANFSAQINKYYGTTLGTKLGYANGGYTGGVDKAMASDFSGLALGIGTVTGVRSFNVDSYGRLTGIHHKQVWVPGDNEAKCTYDTKAMVEILPGQGGSVMVGPAGGFANPNAPTRAELATMVKVPGDVWTSGGFEETLNVPKHDMSTCKCGFYGFYDGSNDYKSDSTVSAVVEGYGETVIGTRGFRSMKAKIVALHIPGYVDKSKKSAVKKTRGKRPVRRALEFFAMREAAAAFGIPGLIMILMGFVSTAAIALLNPFGGREGWMPSVLGISIGVLVAGVGLVALANKIDSVGDELKTSTVKQPYLGLPQVQRERIMRNYPDIPVYSTFEEMVEAHPADRGVEPSPESDPEFWSRPAA